MSIPDLGKWAKHQRDQYILYLRGKPSKMTPSKIEKLISIGFEESIEERAVVGGEATTASTASELLTNNGDNDETADDGIGDLDGVGGSQGEEGGEGYEEEDYEHDGVDKQEEEEDGKSQYATRLDDAIVYHDQQHHLDNGHSFDAPQQQQQQQQYRLPGDIGDLAYNTYGDGNGGSAQHSARQSGILGPFHYPQGEGGMHYPA